MNHADLVVPFIQDNWIWIVLFLAVIAYYLFFEFQTLRYRNYMMSAEKVVQLINKENAQVLDLRPKKFFDDAHISGALNIESDQLLKNQTPVNFQKDKPVILFSGYESDGRKALPAMKEQGFETVYILSGGAQEWKKQNYPFVSSQQDKKKSKKIEKSPSKKV